jgi:uncharacterized protein YgbK (DUF1537 family)
VDDPLGNLPAEWPQDVVPAIRREIARSGRKVVALDDDPTGVQTVHDTPVLARWDVDTLAAELDDPGPLAFILTNSRGLAEDQALVLNREIGANLREASRRANRDVAVISRSDSTLRGHFPAEPDALAAELGPFDAVLLAPVFTAGGRVTAEDVHYVREGDRWTPAGETEFARDATFGYRSSNLREWVAEKSGGRATPEQVGSLSLETIRMGGPEAVAAALREAEGGRVIVVNAVSERDVEVVALGALLAENAGSRLLYRTGASFVRARAGLSLRPLLGRGELLGADAAPVLGLVVVGSHVRRSSEQLAVLLAADGVRGVEVDVRRVVDPATRDREIARATAAVDEAIGHGATAALFTSRELVLADDPEASLRLSRSVSSALVEIVSGLRAAPGWVIGKGGITSSDIGTEALGARRAMVLGQVRPGIPVWRLGPESRRPGMAYIVFPGNVGGPETLAEVALELRGAAGE